jgi:hypothetical protein
MTVTLEALRGTLKGRWLSRGNHSINNVPGCPICGMELLSIVWPGWTKDFLTDDPFDLSTWDFRNLNDAAPDDQTREAILPVIAAYAGCLEWPAPKQYRVLERLVAETMRRVLGLRDWPDHFGEIEEAGFFASFVQMPYYGGLPGNGRTRLEHIFASATLLEEHSRRFGEYVRLDGANLEVYIQDFKRRTVELTGEVMWIVFHAVKSGLIGPQIEVFREACRCWLAAVTR